MAHCPRIRERAIAGELVYDLNFDLLAGTAEWNVDLVIGAPSLSAQPKPKADQMRRDRPARVHIAIELKSVMTEHRKAVKNRKRDLEAHHEHVHNYSNDTIAGGVFVLNASPTFRSPLRSEVSKHGSVEKLVEHCVKELRAVSRKGGPSGYGLDASCALVVVLDNVNAGRAEYLTRPPAPQAGDPLHYDSFIRSICDQYGRRFP